MTKDANNETDILGLLSRMQGQLAALDRKVDLLISRSSQSRPIETRPSPQLPSHGPVRASDPVPGIPRTNDHHNARPMYQAVCADCKKECELPFKPSGDRPVYCKECFSKRKAVNKFKPAVDNKSKETPPVQAPVVSAAAVLPKPPAKEKKKPTAKKPVAKKKPAAKKKKK